MKASLEVKFNLWTKGGNEYFKFSKTPVPKTQSQSWKRRIRRKKDLGTLYREVRSKETLVCEEVCKRALHFDKITTELRPLNLGRPVNTTYFEVVKTVKSFESPAVLWKRLNTETGPKVSLVRFLLFSRIIGNPSKTEKC